MHIKSLIFASLSCVAVCLSYCATAISYPLERVFERWPDFIANPSQSIALDMAVAEFEPTPSPIARFMAFMQRAILHARYTAGRFLTPDGFALC